MGATHVHTRTDRERAGRVCASRERAPGGPRAPLRRRAPAVLLTAVLSALGGAGCEGLSLATFPEGLVVLPPGIEARPDGSLECEASATADAQTLEGLQAAFAREVHPAMLAGEGGCIACHGERSGRPLVVTPDAADTFHRLRASGHLSTAPGSLFARLASPDPAVRMPQGQPAWRSAPVAAVARVACGLSALESRGVLAPADEEFPRALLAPWAGPAPVDHENTFLGHAQLRGKVVQVFGDAWVRAGEDLFASNAGLFGGADFRETFVEARAATPDFLVGLDALAPDVCGAASAGRRGPFAGVDTTAVLQDTPPSQRRQYEAEAAVLASGVTEGAELVASTGARLGTTGWNLYTSGTLTTRTAHTLPFTGTYRVTVSARGTQCGTALPRLEARVDSAVVAGWDVAATTAYAEHTATFPAEAGARLLAVAFTNDFADGTCDRNLYVDHFRIEGPLEPPTGTQRADAARAGARALFQRLLFREASAAEQAASYALLTDLASMGGSVPAAWAGLCEGLMRHPDFLFTLPPSHAAAAAGPGGARERLLLVKLAQDLVARPPTPQELQWLSSGERSWEQLVDHYLSLPAFRDFYFHRMRVRMESDGSPESDEPARLWAYLMRTGEPMQGLLTADFGVAADFTRVARPAHHGRTGVLTMKGYMKNKPGLPHYNYAARVMTGFMGTLYEVPQEVFDLRATATASSTVDPASACFSCHQTLTPLSHQRLRWDEEGNYREADAQGAPIDDSDRGLVPSYAFKGQGLESFALAAVRKEAFVRRTLNAHVQLLFGRELRHGEDERALYRRLWDVARQSGGDLRAVLKAIALSPEYRRTGSTPHLTSAPSSSSDTTSAAAGLAGSDTP
jgi:hypothetical protein